MALYIGLMSGTSADGVDGVLARWGETAAPEVLGHLHQPYADELRGELLALNRPGQDELHRSAMAGLAVARAYAEVVHRLLRGSELSPGEVSAIGAHGQTVRHRPPAGGRPGYSLQLLNGALLAELCDIDVVCDLRSRDLAAGGQGAPLVPALHHALFADPERDVAVLNIGGIANLSLLPARSRAGPDAVIGFDCGPGNALMDVWCERHTGVRYDEDGRWAASGDVDDELLRGLMGEPYLAAEPPKSTGRDLFDAPWLDRQLAARDHALQPQDVQATLAAFTAQAAAQALKRHAPHAHRLLVCGGGARNRHLMQCLSAQLPDVDVRDTVWAGVPVDQVEALAFAWLARAFVRGEPGNLPSVTDAIGPRRLGALYPAR